MRRYNRRSRNCPDAPRSTHPSLSLLHSFTTSVNVFYEEEGTLKVASILADNDTSLQVEAPHGKRSKIKVASVLFRFEQPALPDFMPQAQRASEDLDVDFLWECSSGDEFDYAELAAEYYGHKPAPVESAAVLLKLHGAPMYFYKRGRGRYQRRAGGGAEGGAGERRAQEARGCAQGSVCRPARCRDASGRAPVDARTRSCTNRIAARSSGKRWKKRARNSSSHLRG